MKRKNRVKINSILNRISNIFIALLFVSGSTQLQTKNNYDKPFAYKVKPTFIPLPYGNIEPTGWLRDWSETAKNGLILNNPAIEEGWLDKQPKEWVKTRAEYWVKDIKDFKKAWLHGHAYSNDC